MTARGAILLVPVLLVTATIGGRIAGGEPAPSIRFEKQTHDFGEIPATETVRVRWVFHNDGDAPLHVLGTKPTCGCTASVIDPDAILPGKSGALDVSFDPRGQQGSVRKSIAVTTDDPERRRILLTVKATVLPRDLPAAKDGHPPILGQSLLMGQCASCHAAPAAGKSGEGLYGAVCAPCHGAEGEGRLAPTLRSPDYLASNDDDELADAIAYGTANPRMPGFSNLMGGPLDDEQIRSLVELLRLWGPLEDTGSIRSQPPPPPTTQ